jgi:hypothetical protein
MTTGRWLTVVGCGLQFVGVLFVFFEIGQTERLLRLQSLWARTAQDIVRPLRSLLGHLGLRRPKRHAVALEATATGHADFSARYSVIPGEGTSIEERLDSHRRQLDELRALFERVRQELNRDHEAESTALAAAEDRLSTEIEALKRLVTELGGGFLQGRALGAIVILAGTVMIGIGAVLG